jgi:hypothetical protein
MLLKIEKMRMGCIFTVKMAKRKEFPLLGLQCKVGNGIVISMRCSKVWRRATISLKVTPPPKILIEDYSCALSKEILVQGRMYVSEHYICFNSNIFGWVTNVYPTDYLAEYS